MGPSPLHKAQLRSALKNLPPFAGSLRCLWCRSMLYCMLGRKAHSLTLLLCLKENSWSVLIGQIRVWIWLMYTLLSKISLIMCMCAGLCVVCALGCGCPQRPVASRSLKLELQIVVSRPGVCWLLKWDFLHKQCTLLTAWSSLQPPCGLLLLGKCIVLQRLSLSCIFE